MNPIDPRRALWLGNKTVTVPPNDYDFTVPFSYAEIDTRGLLVDATGRFTITDKSEGFYLASLSSRFLAPTGDGGTYRQAVLAVNGDFIVTSTAHADAGVQMSKKVETPQVSDAVYLTSGDIVEVYLAHNAAGSLSGMARFKLTGI